MSQSKEKSKQGGGGFTMDDLYKLQLGGVSSAIGTSFMHPVDTAKEEGVGRKGIYKGMSAALLREVTYSAMRLGFYEPFKRTLGATDPKNTPLWIKFTAGGLAGLCASGIANPADLIKTRMQSQLPGQAKSFKWHTRYIYNQAGGLSGFYEGVSATMLRATILNAVYLGSYDATKHNLMNTGYFKEGICVQFIACTVTGLLVACCSSPVDNLKTVVMTQRFDLPESPNNPRYSSLLDCAQKMYQKEGARSFFKGFLPQWVGFAPYIIIQFIIWEKLRSLLGLGNI